MATFFQKSIAKDNSNKQIYKIWDHIISSVNLLYFINYKNHKKNSWNLSINYENNQNHIHFKSKGKYLFAFEFNEHLENFNQDLGWMNMVQMLSWGFSGISGGVLPIKGKMERAIIEKCVNYHENQVKVKQQWRKKIFFWRNGCIF